MRALLRVFASRSPSVRESSAHHVPDLSSTFDEAIETHLEAPKGLRVLWTDWSVAAFALVEREAPAVDTALHPLAAQREEVEGKSQGTSRGSTVPEVADESGGGWALSFRLERCVSVLEDEAVPDHHLGDHPSEEDRKDGGEDYEHLNVPLAHGGFHRLEGDREGLDGGQGEDDHEEGCGGDQKASGAEDEVHEERCKHEQQGNPKDGYLGRNRDSRRKEEHQKAKGIDGVCDVKDEYGRP